jgi:hypothetical protein
MGLGIACVGVRVVPICIMPALLGLLLLLLLLLQLVMFCRRLAGCG